MEYTSYSYFHSRNKNDMEDDTYSFSDSYDDSFEDSSNISSESIDELVSAEKVYVCDYDKIYICMYEAIEKYRILKQSKKKNLTTNWNELVVILQDGKTTNIKNAPDKIYKNVKKSIPIEKTKIDNTIQSKPIVTINQNTNLSSNNEKITINETKKELPKQIKQEKMSKKQLKKQRQKEKKETQKQKDDEKKKQLLEKKSENINKTNSKLVNELKENFKNEENNKESVNNETNTNDNIKNLDNIIETEEDDDIVDDQNILDENTAFVSNALKKSEKKDSVKTKKIERKEVVTKKIPTKVNININKKEIKPSLPSTSGSSSTLNSSMKKSDTAFDVKESISLGKRAITLLMENKISKAIQFLNEAIRFNSFELRHFLNRSFCYLRIGEYKSALKDAESVIKVTKDNEQLVTAKFRAGQAYCGLQNFKEAEKFLDEAYNFSQANSAIHQELLRVKILQLLSMGFRERDILEVLRDCPTVEGAITLLADKTITDDDDNDYIYKNVDNDDDDDIYNSDDEDNPCLTRLFRSLSNYQQSFVKKPSIPSLCTLKIPTPQSIIQPKVVTTINSKVPIIKDVNDRAIWVGNTTSIISDPMIKKFFSKYGKIVSLYRKPNENYTFINFENAKSVRELLTGNSYVELDNIKLPIKSATRNFK
ncbi:uncharacterized protein LOC127283181 [Leptopilina boulardi]|uniref:uncharacterized protein LOC127283181 n=1 Tax=Leptopilina boulardi TaxID=63433 RepID=UPI0021F5A65E|nr:uncharacterized protein LOC127283181 [Leptopilina boulardi]